MVRKHLLLLLCGVASAALALACARDPAARGAPEAPTALLANHYPCGAPELANREGRMAALDAKVADWVTWDIPEYQDAQRFTPGASDRTYGALACTVANPQLASLTPANFTAGALVAVLYVDNSGAITGAYTALKITNPGYYCVIIRGDVTNATVPAYVVPSVNRACQETSESNRLTAFPVQYGSTDSADYPAVSRFLIQKSWRPAIGVRCLDRWCSIGSPSLADLQPPPHGSRPPGSPGYVRHTVSGWYDQQHVAIGDASAPFHLKARLDASVVPVDSLDNWDLGRFNTRTLVATVYFADDPAGTKYATTWRFRHHGPDTLELLHASNGSWSVYINGVLNPKLTVTRHDHSAAGVHIVGTARWAWRDTDEGIWVRCAEGCCEVEEIVQ